MATLIRRKWTWSSISATISFVEASLILAKIGTENVPSNLATSIRTVVVLLVAWTIVLGKRKAPFVKQAPKKELLFLVLSGFATAGSWLCYYDAIAQGQVNVVVLIDKLSVLLTVLFSVLVLKEKLRWKSWLGLGLLVAGTVCMAVFPKGFQNSTSGLK